MAEASADLSASTSPIAMAATLSDQQQVVATPDPAVADHADGADLAKSAALDDIGAVDEVGAVDDIAEAAMPDATHETGSMSEEISTVVSPSTAAAEPTDHRITEPAAGAAPDADAYPSPLQPEQFAPSEPPTRRSQKDKIMEMSNNFANGLNDVLAEAQDKAKEVYEKSSSMLGEAGSFTRGNVEAVVEAGKILAAGLQDMNTNLVAESRGAFETMTADLKELAASKTPADFFKIQGDMMRKNLDSAVAMGSKNSEAMLKLVTDALAPLSGRMSAAVEKVKSPIV